MTKRKTKKIRLVEYYGTVRCTIVQFEFVVVQIECHCMNSSHRSLGRMSNEELPSFKKVYRIN